MYPKKKSSNSKKKHKKKNSWKSTHHKVLSSTILELLHLFSTVIILHMRFYKKNSIEFGSHPRTEAWKRKLLLVKYIYKKQQIKKIGSNKKESYNLLEFSTQQ